MSSRTRFFLLASPIILVVVLVGIGIFEFMQYRNNRLDGLQTVPMPSVAITSPQPYSQASVRFPVHVNVTANGYKPFKTVELWINGLPMGRQDAPLPDTMLKTTFAWQPGAPGEFSLIARVTDQDGNTALSPAVLVDVAAFNPGADAVNGRGDDNGAGGVYPAATTGGSGGGGGSAPVPPPGPDQSSTPATSGGPSIADWITNLTNKQAPAAPELAASVDGCSVNLQIHDLSNNEEGFQVFRSLNNAAGWDKIATLNSQSQAAWISYSDKLVAGNQASYYVAAINGAGQTQSNPVSASIDPAKCGTAPADQQVLQIDIKSFDTGGADNPYCYRSFDNTHWGRWPENGFLDPASLSLNPQATEMTFTRKALSDGLPGLGKLGLWLECWGWTGGQLTFLGKVKFSNTDLSSAGLHPADDGGLHIILITVDDPHKVHYKLPVPAKSANMPFISAWLSYDPNQCKTHLPANAQNDGGVILFCEPFPGYTSGAKSASPQPYLIWMVLEHTCPAGFNTDCATLADLQNDVTQLGGQVNFVVRQSNINFDDFIGTNVPIGFTSFVVPLKDCPSDISATVQLDLETPKGSAASVMSNTVTIPCTPPVGATVPVNVSFDSITLNNVQDGDGGTQTVELYGSFTVITSNFTRFLSLGNSNSGARSDANCPNENVFQGFHTNGLGGVGCLQSFENGTSNLTDPEICLTSVEWECKLNGKTTVFKQNNNTMQVPIGNNGILFLKAEVWDYDNASADDLVCLNFGLTVPRKLLDWKTAAPQKINLTSPDFGSGSCTIHVTIAPAN